MLKSTLNHLIFLFLNILFVFKPQVQNLDILEYSLNLDFRASQT
jgi:hypothetical protein